MGYDPYGVTWAPRVDATGDDKYNVPGGTKLDGSIDTGLPSRIEAGTAAGFAIITVSTRARTSNVATIVTATVHGFTVGQLVHYYNSSDSTFVGNATIVSTPTTTSFTYANAGANVAATSDTGARAVPVPTVAAIDATSGLNQIVAMINRRAMLRNIYFGTTLAPTNYALASGRISTSVFNSIRTAINTLRASEGFTAYTFVTTPTTNNLILGSHLAEMRKALRIAGVMTRTSQSGNGSSNTGYRASYSISYPTPTAEDISTSWQGSAGKVLTAGNVSSSRRSLESFAIPDFVTGITSASLSVTLNTISGAEAFDGVVYLSDTDDTNPGVAQAFNTDTLCGSFTPAIGVNSVSVVPADLVAKAGTRASFIIGTDVEIARGGSATQAGFMLWGFATLAIDFGA